MSACLESKRLAFQLTYFIFFILFFINSSILCMGLLTHLCVDVRRQLAIVLSFEYMDSWSNSGC